MRDDPCRHHRHNRRLLHDALQDQVQERRGDLHCHLTVVAAIHRRVLLDPHRRPQWLRHALPRAVRHRLPVNLRFCRHLARADLEALPLHLPLRGRRDEEHRFGAHRGGGEPRLQRHPQGRDDHRPADHADHPCRCVDGLHERDGRLRHADAYRRGLQRHAGHDLLGVHQ